ETDEAGKERLATLSRYLADKSEELSSLEQRWASEKQSLNAVGDIKKSIDETRSAAERAQREGDLETASRLMYQELPAMEKQLQAAQEAEDTGSAESMVHDAVGADDIAEVVASWTGIPVGRLLEGETGKLLRRDSETGKRLIGQKPAVTAVSD